MTSPNQLGYVLQVLIAWVACWCLQAMPALARAGPAPLRARPANGETYAGGCLRATPVRMPGARF
jgi:hypothetical protein